MKKTIKLSERQLIDIVKMNINEQESITNENIEKELLKSKKELKKWISSYANSFKEKIQEEMDTIFIEYYVDSEVYQNFRDVIEKSDPYKKLLNLYGLLIKYRSKRKDVDPEDLLINFINDLDIPFDIEVKVRKKALE